MSTKALVRHPPFGRSSGSGGLTHVGYVPPRRHDFGGRPPERTSSLTLANHTGMKSASSGARTKQALHRAGKQAVSTGLAVATASACAYVAARSDADGVFRKYPVDGVFGGVLQLASAFMEGEIGDAMHSAAIGALCNSAATYCRGRGEEDRVASENRRHAERAAKAATSGLLPYPAVPAGSASQSDEELARIAARI